MKVKKWTKDMSLKERQRNFINSLIKEYGLEDYICIILDDKLSDRNKYPEGIQSIMDELGNNGLMMFCGKEIEYHKADYPDHHYKNG